MITCTAFQNVSCDVLWCGFDGWGAVVQTKL